MPAKETKARIQQARLAYRSATTKAERDAALRAMVGSGQ